MKFAIVLLVASIITFTAAAPRVYSIGNTVYFVQNDSAANFQPELLAENTFEDTASRFEEVGDDEVADVVGFPVESTTIKIAPTEATEKPESAVNTVDDSRFQEVGLDEITDVVGTPTNLPHSINRNTPFNKTYLIETLKSFVSKLTEKFRNFFRSNL